MIDEKELLSMKIIHYFIVNENYTPIIIKGITDEVWLENKFNSYSIIRVVTKDIHNFEQYDFDIVKTRHIGKQIKRKTLDFSMNILSIYVNNSYENISIDDKRLDSISVNNDEEFINNEYINSSFKDVKDKFKYDKEGFDLIVDITNQIGDKNMIESQKREKIMKVKKPVITFIILLINVIVFCLMYILGKGSEDTYTLVAFGANYVKLTLAGDYYRIITCGFLHIGVIHLLLNMYSLWLIGPQIEYFYGKVKYIIIYLFSMIMGSLFTIALSPSNTISAGASGAIFGLLGSIIYFAYHYRGYIGSSILGQILPVVAINLFIGFSMPGIDNYAHIGGLIGGYIISMALGFTKEDKVSKVNGIIISTILLMFMIYIGFIK